MSDGERARDGAAGSGGARGPAVRCPFCRDAIDDRADGVRCARCATPHHRECWHDTGGRCTVYGCGSAESRPFTRRAAARIVVTAGRRAVSSALGAARERLGGKVAAGALLVLCALAGAVPALLVSRGAPASVRAALVTAPIMAVLAAWVTVLVYRGTHVEDDLSLRPAEASVEDYYRRLWGGLTGERDRTGRGLGGGCADGCSGGCAPAGGEELLVLLAILAAVAVAGAILPLVAWLVVELVVPVVVVGCYTVVYGALAAAVNGSQRLAGRLGASAAHGLLVAAVYGAIVFLFAWAGFALRG